MADSTNDTVPQESGIPLMKQEYIPVTPTKNPPGDITHEGSHVSGLRNVHDFGVRPFPNMALLQMNSHPQQYPALYMNPFESYQNGLFGSQFATTYPYYSPAVSAMNAHGSQIPVTEGQPRIHAPVTADAVSSASQVVEEADVPPVTKAKRSRKPKTRTSGVINVSNSGGTSANTGTTLRPPQDVQLFFQSRDEALKAMQAPAWHPPKDDPTIPTTNEARREWVRKLVGAFTDISNTKDKSGPVFRKRWYNPSKPTPESYKSFYGREEIEKICWDIEDCTERLHREGPGFFTCYDPEFQKDFAKTQHFTFADRMNTLLTLFRHYKARCDKMFKYDILQTYIADPVSMLETANQNRGANDSRQVLIKQGRRHRGIVSPSPSTAIPSPSPAMNNVAHSPVNHIAQPRLPESIRAMRSGERDIDGELPLKVSFKRSIDENYEDDDEFQPLAKRLCESSPLSSVPDHI